MIEKRNTPNFKTETLEYQINTERYYKRIGKIFHQAREICDTLSTLQVSEKYYMPKALS